MNSLPINPTARPAAPMDETQNRSMLGDVPSWVVSCALHLAVLFALFNITLVNPFDVDPQIESEIAETEIVPDDFLFDPTVTDQLGSDSDVNTLSPSKAAATQAGQDPQKELETQIEEELLSANIPMPEIETPSEAEFVDVVSTTGASEHTGGVEGAVDRLTIEIAASLKDNKTLCIWLFDASLSLKERRKAISERFENVYAQLGQLEVNPERALKTAVASFGKTTNILTPDPVDDVSAVVKAVETITPDTSGRENVFAAVSTVSKKWSSYRTKMRRNMMIVVVTDERGDDFENLEDAIVYARRLGIRIYCVGNAAPFGREKGYVQWTYKDGGTEMLPVDAGPETIRPERVQLGFWGGRGRDLAEMSSGFGPYALTRMCAETGGLYLISEESNRGPKFDRFVMRQYAPEYITQRKYEANLQSNAAKGALIAAANNTYGKQINPPRLNFRADSDNTLRTEVTEAQKPVAVIDNRLRGLEATLTGGEKARAKLNTPRWRASYDLALGRVLAMRVRLYGYNIMLADMKSNPKTFQKKGSNHWRLVPAKEVDAGPNVRKLAKKAKEYLHRVVDDHNGTPWGLLAERELEQPLGWAWEEYSVSLPGMNGNGNNNNNPALQLAEERRRREEMRRREAERKRVRPVL